MQKPSPRVQEQGFTLVEILIALVVSLIILSAAVLFFQGMNRTNTVQSDLANMEQNLRAITNMMARDLRMANYDPITSYGGIQAAAADTVTFTYEINDDGDLRTVRYLLYDAYGDNDTDIGRAFCDGDSCDIDKATIVPVAENIDAIEFLYLDKDGEQTADLDKITTISFSVLARTSRSEPNFLNTFDYFPASCPQPDPPATPDDSCITGAQWTAANPTWNFDGNIGNNANAFNDNFRRRLLTSTIQLRN